MSHAPFPPSSAKRWLACPGSYAQSLLTADPGDSDYSREGSRLHGVAKSILEGQDTDNFNPSDVKFLEPYIDYAVARMAHADAFAIEETIEHSDFLFGTPDLLCYFKRDNLLEVVDLKCGQGIMVDPVENHQLLTYAYMALSKMAWDSVTWPDGVRLTIVQPYDEDDQVKIWDTTAPRVWEHGAKVEMAIKAALAGGAALVPGDHCRFCKAKGYCPKLRGEVIEALGSGLMPATMTPPALAMWLDRADRLAQWMDAVREVSHKYASEALAQGRPGIPGYALKPKRITRQWADEDKVLEIARRRRIKIWQDKLLSPAMAEKAHPNMPDELKAQIVAVSSGTNLVKLPAGEAQALPVAANPEASKMERLMANFDLQKYRS